MAWSRERLTAPLFIVVWLGLLALTATSFGLSYVHIGAWELPVALTIAVAKAALVVLFFMHLIAARFILTFVLALGVAWLVVLASLTALDVATREPPLFKAPLGRVSE